jgi:ribonuclease HI
MKKSEILRNLKKLTNIFEGDNEALNALDVLTKKAEELPEDKKSKNENPDSFPLPEELRELSMGFAVFADGACRGNPGPGAWATMIQDTKAQIILRSTGVDMPTTNNKMELEGVIRGLNGLIEKWIEDGISDHESPVFVYSDSKYVIEGIEKWVSGWKARGWKKADGKEPENLNLWRELDQLKSRFNHITFLWVKGHAGHPQNEMCDKMANLALDEAGF